MRYLLCAVIGTPLLLAGGTGCDGTRKKPEITIPTQMLELPGDPVPAGSGGPRKAKPTDEGQPKNDREPPR